MALPKYNEFYRLVLTVLQDGQSHSMKEVRDSIAQTLQLTEEDLSETLSNGSSVYAGRVGWAKTYLKKAEMIDSPQRGYIAITPAGRSLLASTEPITNAVLAQKCPAFLDFYRPQNTAPLLHNRRPVSRMTRPKHRRRPSSGCILLSTINWRTIC